VLAAPIRKGDTFTLCKLPLTVLHALPFIGRERVRVLLKPLDIIRHSAGLTHKN
jgi:hypothetical protein